MTVGRRNSLWTGRNQAQGGAFININRYLASADQKLSALSLSLGSFFFIIYLFIYGPLHSERKKEKSCQRQSYAWVVFSRRCGSVKTVYVCFLQTVGAYSFLITIQWPFKGKRCSFLDFGSVSADLCQQRVQNLHNLSSFTDTEFWRLLKSSWYVSVKKCWTINTWILLHQSRFNLLLQ